MVLGSLPARQARANGRLPNTTQLDINPHNSNQWVLGVTNGMAFSHDGGRTFGWVCENVVVNTQAAFVDAQGFQGADYRLVFGSRGELLVEGGNQAARSHDGGLTWAPMPGLPHGPHISFGQLSGDPHTPNVAYLPTFDITAQVGTLWRTLDAGGSWRPMPLQAKGILWTAVRASPVRPGQLMAVGANFFAHLGPFVSHSSDAGKSWGEVSRALSELIPETGQFGQPDLLWHPTDPNTTIFKGMIFSTNSTLQLVHSPDAGKSGRIVLSLPVEHRGMAATADGKNLFLAATDQNIWRSQDGGISWRALPQPRHNACVTSAMGAIFLCGNQRDDGFSLGVSADGGDSIHRLFNLDALRAARFARGSLAARRCPDLWAPFAPIIGATAGGERPSSPPASAARFDPQLLSGPSVRARLAASAASRVGALAPLASPAPAASPATGAGLGDAAATGSASPSAPPPTAGCSCGQAGGGVWGGLGILAMLTRQARRYLRSRAGLARSGANERLS